MDNFYCALLRWLVIIFISNIEYVINNRKEEEDGRYNKREGKQEGSKW